MERLFVVCGQSGVGKSTVLSKVAEGHDDLTIVNFGETILSIARDRGVASTTEEFAGLKPETVAELQVAAANRVKSLEGRVILDMHLTVRTRGGFIAGMPKKLMDMLSPSRIILLEADPYEVLKRRMVGKEMKKVDDSLKDIQEHADFDRAAAVAIAIDIGAPVKLIMNDDVEKTATEIGKLIDEG